MNIQQRSGLGMGTVGGIIFIAIGALAILNGFGRLPIAIGGFDTVLLYGAALGSILGGFSMLFKKRDVVQKIN